MGFSILRFLRHVLSDFDATHRESVSALTVMEMEELENTFLAVELLPHLERELQVLNQRAKDASDMFAEMCGTLGID